MKIFGRILLMPDNKEPLKELYKKWDYILLFF